MSKHNSNDDRHDSKSSLAKASHTVSPSKRSVMTEPRGGEAAAPKIQVPGKAVMEESQETQKGFKRGGRTSSKGGHQPKAPGFAHKHGTVLPSQTDTPPVDLNQAATGKKRGGRRMKDGGAACDDGMAEARGDRPMRKARGGAATMRGRSPMSSAATTELPSRANTH